MCRKRPCIDPGSCCTVLAGCCLRCGTQTCRIPGRRVGLGFQPGEPGLVLGQAGRGAAYSERIGSAAVMIVDDGVVVDAWGDLEHKYLCHSMRKSLISALYGIYVADGKIDLTRDAGGPGH